MELQYPARISFKTSNVIHLDQVALLWSVVFNYLVCDKFLVAPADSSHRLRDREQSSPRSQSSTIVGLPQDESDADDEYDDISGDSSDDEPTTTAPVPRRGRSQRTRSIVPRANTTSARNQPEAPIPEHRASLRLNTRSFYEQERVAPFERFIEQLPHFTQELWSLTWELADGLPSSSDVEKILVINDTIQGMPDMEPFRTGYFPRNTLIEVAEKMISMHMLHEEFDPVHDLRGYVKEIEKAVRNIL